MRTPIALCHTPVSDWLWVVVSHEGLCLPESEPERQGGISTLERGRDLCFQPDRPQMTFVPMLGASIQNLIKPPVYPSICLSIHYPSILLSTRQFIHPSIQLSIDSSFQTPLHPFVHASNYSTSSVHIFPSMAGRQTTVTRTGTIPALTDLTS